MNPLPPDVQAWLARAPWDVRVLLCASLALWALIASHLPGTLYRWHYCGRMALYCERFAVLVKASETRVLTPLELDEAEHLIRSLSQRPKWLAQLVVVRPEVLAGFELWLQTQKAPTSALPRGGGSEEAGTQESGTRGV